MLVTLAMVFKFSKNLVLFIQVKNFYKPVKFPKNLRGWVAFHHFFDHLTWNDPASIRADKHRRESAYNPGETMDLHQHQCHQ